MKKMIVSCLMLVSISLMLVVSGCPDDQPGNDGGTPATGTCAQKAGVCEAVAATADACVAPCNFSLAHCQEKASASEPGSCVVGPTPLTQDECTARAESCEWVPDSCMKPVTDPCSTVKSQTACGAVTPAGLCTWTQLAPIAPATKS